MQKIRRIISLTMAVFMALGILPGIGPFKADAVNTVTRQLDDNALRSLAPKPLSSVPVPEPSNLKDFVWNKKMAIALGKALFWDMQAGSDGQACATCHFHAGVDSRAKNQLSTGFLANPSDLVFDPTPTGGGGPNYTLRHADFPFPATGGENGVGLNDVASSMGVFKSEFVKIEAGGKETCKDVPDPVWQVGGINVRRVEPRQTPSSINAVFNHRNFWDGRANNIFNGVSPLGRRDVNARVWKRGANGQATPVKIELDNSSLASQAVGPPLSDFEMSCAGRKFPDVGRKLLQLRPLARQQVAIGDSALALFRHPTGKGLWMSYPALIKAAFRPEWWSATGTVDGTYTQMEANFSLFWGIAIQLYEATLVANQTKFDSFAAGINNALSEQEKLGLEMFLTKGRCINCHAGPEFTGASVRLRACPPFGNQEAIERMIMGDGNAAVYDGGFYNIGVRPTFEDLAVGGNLAGFPLSFSRQEVNGPKIDIFCFDANQFAIPGPIVPGERVAVDGAFKTPTVRNAALTAPYFHSGGHASLQQVVEFYDRGGDFRGLNQDNLDPDIQPIGFAPEEEQALIAFLNALTDQRVNYEKAPFDHPELIIPKGELGDGTSVVTIDGKKAVDDLISIPAVGFLGRAVRGLPPLANVGFESNLE
jgi:cytochrome c peroxidase